MRIDIITPTQLCEQSIAEQYASNHLVRLYLENERVHELVNIIIDELKLIWKLDSPLFGRWYSSWQTVLWQGGDGIIVSESFVRAIQETEIIIPSYIINGLDIAVSEESITVSETFYLPTNRPVVHLQGSIIVLNEGIAPMDEWTELSNGAYVSEEGIIVESYFMIDAGKDDRSDD